jgi:phosphoribosylaminoimidazole (AIR) synthetase
MIAVVAADDAGKVMASFEASGEQPFALGTVVPQGQGERVSYDGALDLAG